MKKFIARHRDQLKEIGRFVIVGVVATIADYCTNILFMNVIYTDASQWTLGWFQLTKNLVVATLAGFIVGVIVNYIMSIFFVFHNVANKHTSRSVGGFIVFVILGFIGLLINLGIKQLGDNIIRVNNHPLWFAFVFCVATGIVLIYNYITRKLILFRPKKSNESTSVSEESTHE